MWPPRLVFTALIRARKFWITDLQVSMSIFLICRLMAVLSSASVFGGGQYTLLLTKPHRKKSNGFKSGECGGHESSVFRDINRLPNVSSSHSKTLLEVCGAAPSCWKYILSLSSPFFLKDGRNLLLRRLTYCSDVTVAVPPLHRNMVQLHQQSLISATHAVTLSLCNGFSWKRQDYHWTSSAYSAC